MSLLDVVRKRTQQATLLDDVALRTIINEDDSVLHDPMLYDGMSDLINQLHEYKQYQEQHPNSIMIVDTDYDTDGVMSTTTLSAALNVFGFNYRLYIPSMKDGYGLNINAINEMKDQYEKNGLSIDLILTADNGTNAIAGVDYANTLGIKVLVTDHHLGGDDYANASVIVNPNKTLPDGSEEPYPFKGNAGATVAWKTMQAYAKRYATESVRLIDQLVVFAGIANVSDVMPIIDENHYMVKQSVKEMKRLVHIRSLYETNAFGGDNKYNDVMNTPYGNYNVAFHGLYDMIDQLQTSKDEKRIAKGKKTIPLTIDEELIGWYLSPMINAPRRIHGTCKEAMMAFNHPSSAKRQTNIKAMIAMNEQKSEMRNLVLDQINWPALMPNSGNVLFVNAQHGIAGLIAGQVTQRTGKASIVFALPSNSDAMVYTEHQFDDRFDKDTLEIGASARSTHTQPLDVIMNQIKEIRPDIITGGGGHAAAAGYTIMYKHLSVFTMLFNNVAKQVETEVKAGIAKMIKDGLIEQPIENAVTLSFYDGKSTPESVHYNIRTHASTLMNDMMEVHSFQQALKPFGKDFNAQTKFIIELDPTILTEAEYNLNLDFWKTLKFNLYGIDVLTFNIDLADTIKDRINNHNPSIVTANAKLVMNTFRGKTTPQLQLE